MLEDQLLEIARLEHYRELVKAANLARQFDAAHQVDRDVDPVLAQVVQKSVLHILRIECAVIHIPLASRLISLSFIFTPALFAWREEGPGVGTAEGDRSANFYIVQESRVAF